jgi:hypothetical protein
MPLGGLVTILILIPNALWVIFPSKSLSVSETITKNSITKMMGIMEGTGRIAVFCIPVFYHFDINGKWAYFIIVIMAGALCIYYTCWMRYFIRGRAYSLLYAPLRGFPIPMAVSPVVFFLSASIVLHSAPLAIAATILGIGHIYMSWLVYQRLTKKCSNISPNRIGGGFSPPPSTPPGMRVRTRRFPKSDGP